jgi:hypothetical protein
MTTLGKTCAALLLATVASAQIPPTPYLRCFRDEGGKLHEVLEKMPDAPPPTIQVPPPTTTTTLPSLSFSYTPKLHWRLVCLSGVGWGPWLATDNCLSARSWLIQTCPKKRVDKTDGFSSGEEIRVFRQGCGADNGMSCRCTPEYY